MHELYIDPVVFCGDVAEGKPLPSDHLAKTFAAGLPDWHPVKRLFTGASQKLGESKNVLGFLMLFSEVYDDRIREGWKNGADAPLAPEQVAAEIEAFKRLIPDDVLYRGRSARTRAYGMRMLHANARDAVMIMTRDFPPLRTVLLDAFDRTFAKLIRAVRLS